MKSVPVATLDGRISYDASGRDFKPWFSFNPAHVRAEYSEDGDPREFLRALRREEVFGTDADGPGYNAGPADVRRLTLHMSRLWEARGGTTGGGLAGPRRSM